VGASVLCPATMLLPSPSVVLSFTLVLLPLVSAYSWSFQNQPRQCQNLNITIDGTGQPPYSVLILPFGATPLPNNVEARIIVNIPFDGTTANFQLKYPSNSQFVAVVSSPRCNLDLIPTTLYRSAMRQGSGLVGQV
jgi:hypothetical protein